MTEHISEVLEKLLQHELEVDDVEEESVFNNTITFQWGQEIARRVRRNSEQNGEDEVQTDINVNVINSQVDTHCHSDSTAPKVLQIYNDMGQEE